MKTSMVQNNGISNQTNFMGVKLLKPNPTSLEKYGKLIEDLAGVDEFKKLNVELEPGAFGVTTRLTKLFGLIKDEGFYLENKEISFNAMKEGILGLIKK